MKHTKTFLSFCLAIYIFCCTVGCNTSTDDNSSTITSKPTNSETNAIVTQSENQTSGNNSIDKDVDIVTSTSNSDSSPQQTSSIHSNSSQQSQNSSKTDTDTTTTEIENNSISTDPQDIPVPDFTGKTYEETTTYKEKFKIKYKWEKNSEHSYGIVFEQSIKAGTITKPNTEITLLVSMGVPVLKIPDTYGLEKDSAISLLTEKGFEVIIVEISDENVEEGKVIKTEPKRATSVIEHSKVTVYINKKES